VERDESVMRPFEQIRVHPLMPFRRFLYFAGFSAWAIVMQFAPLALVAAAEPGDERKPVLRPLRLAFDGGELTLRGSLTYGTIVRAEDRDPALLTAGNAARLGIQGTARGGVAMDDGNLNYGQGDAVSTALKGLFDVELKYADRFRAFVRLKAWDDRAQRRDNVAHGNVVNGYVASAPLSDDGFSRHATFGGAVLMDAYAEGKFTAAGEPMVVRLGSQSIEWGQQQRTILGGLEQINAIDFAARFRAGAAVKDEAYVPVPGAFFRWGTPAKTTVEAFYLFRFQQNEQAGCGTFYAPADYIADGCDKVVAQPPALSDPVAIATDLIVRRAPDSMPSDGGQYGIGMTHVSSVGRFGAYFANYHSRRASASPIKSSRTTMGGIPLVPGDPGGENVRYSIEYPDNIRMFGLTYGAFKGNTAFAIEYTYRPNQVALLNSYDLFNAFASNVALSMLRADATATAPGSAYRGYDRLKVSQLTVSVRHPHRESTAGAFSFVAEAGFKYVHELPDVTVRRYGRSDVFGIGPVNGVCPPGASAVQCSYDGYVTPLSWGYRFRLQKTFHQVLNGVDLAPFLFFSHDVKGWSYDGNFNEGSKRASVGVRADLRKSAFFEVAWSPIWGGTYNGLKDRDVYTVFGGVQF